MQMKSLFNISFKICWHLSLLVAFNYITNRFEHIFLENMLSIVIELTSRAFPLEALGAFG